MRVGFHTNIWGPRITDLEGMLDIIAAAGYEGVEFAQRPEMLGSMPRLLELMAERNLTLLGLAGGTLLERMNFCDDERPLYLYVEDWDANIAPVAVAHGFTLALHPHMFKRVESLDDAQRILETHRNELKWLPDTAHLTLAGSDPAEAILLMKDRLAAVHLKDWTPAYGQSYYRYSRGFTELGQGIVNLQAVLHQLRTLNYSGWLVVEQDNTRTNPQSSALSNAQWLKINGILRTEPKPAPSLCKQEDRSIKYPNNDMQATELLFARIMQRASLEDIQECYNSIVSAFKELVPCELSTLWAYNSTTNRLTLLAADPPYLWNGEQVLPAENLLSEITLARQTITHFDLDDPHPGRKYGWPEARAGCSPPLGALKSRHMITVPILNSYNHNQVRLILNLFLDCDWLRLDDYELFTFGMDVARVADSVLDDRCSYAAAYANFLASQCKEAKEYTHELALMMRKAIDCEGVSIFLVNNAGNRLELAGTTGIVWNVPPNARFYRKGEGLAGEVWERGESMLMLDGRRERGVIGKSMELGTVGRDAWLFTPLINTRGKVLGVVRCLNKRSKYFDSFNMFSDDDVAIIDATGQAAVHHLEMLRSEEQRAIALSRLTHELYNPLVAIHGAVQCMEWEFTDRAIRPEDFFSEDYIGDVLSYKELMVRLINNADFSGLVAKPLRIQATPTFLMGEVIAPALRQVGLLLRERNFTENAISYSRFEQVQKLWIDKSQFQQVMFNLLSNAIKYAFNDPQLFRVNIDGKRIGDRYYITFQDWGPGIDEDIIEAIFEEGMRGSEALSAHIAGQGLGLSVVRRIIEAHGGEVRVTNTYRPTEFAIFLPASLAQRPPR